MHWRHDQISVAVRLPLATCKQNACLCVCQALLCHTTVQIRRDSINAERAHFTHIHKSILLRLKLWRKFTIALFITIHLVESFYIDSIGTSILVHWALNILVIEIYIEIGGLHIIFDRFFTKFYPYSNVNSKFRCKKLIKVPQRTNTTKDRSK